MAIINTYPKATPKGNDLLIGTQVKDDNITENSTKSFSVNSIKSLIEGSGVKTAEVTVTDAQIRTLGTVPVEIIPSTANASIQIIGLTTQNKGSGPLGSNYDWSSSGNGVFYGQGFPPTQHQVEIPNSYLPEGSSLAPDIYVASITPGTMKAGSSLRLSTTTGVNPSIPIGESPSAEMIVNVTYRIIPII